MKMQNQAVWQWVRKVAAALLVLMLSVSAFAQNAATTTTTTPANWMTMEQVQTRLESTGYRDFEKFERDSNK